MINNRILNLSFFISDRDTGDGGHCVLPESLIIRGEIADLTAEAAINLKHTDTVNKCYEAADKRKKPYD